MSDCELPPLVLCEQPEKELQLTDCHCNITSPPRVYLCKGVRGHFLSCKDYRDVHKKALDGVLMKKLFAVACVIFVVVWLVGFFLTAYLL